MIDALRIIAALAVVIGAGFGFLAALGLVRFPDIYTRIHAASKAGVVGAGFIFLGLALMSLDLAVILRSIIAILFLLMTTPVSAHLLARSAYVARVEPNAITKVDEAKRLGQT
jgi:multicomponent Na+:H+ antiporter subunit G